MLFYVLPISVNKDVLLKGDAVGGKEKGWKKKGRGNGRGSEGRDGTPLFGTK